MTEILPEYVDRLKHRGVDFYISMPGLWYEHRRDAHNDYHEPNGNVWAPPGPPKRGEILAALDHLLAMRKMICGVRLGWTCFWQRRRSAEGHS